MGLISKNWEQQRQDHHQVIPHHTTCRGDHPTVQWAGEKELFGQNWTAVEEGEWRGWLRQTWGKRERLQTGLGLRRAPLCKGLYRAQLWGHLRTSDSRRASPGSSLIFRLRNSTHPEHAHLPSHRAPRVQHAYRYTHHILDPQLRAASQPVLGVDAPPVCHTHGQRLTPWCHRLGQLGGGTAPWFILFPWVTNVPALPCPAEAAHGDDMGRPCSLDNLLQQRWGSLPRRPAPHVSTCQLDLGGAALLFLALISPDYQPVLFWIFFLPGARGLSNSTCKMSLPPMVSQINQLLSLKPTMNGVAENDHGRWWGQRISWKDITGLIG